MASPLVRTRARGIPKPQFCAVSRVYRIPEAHPVVRGMLQYVGFVVSMAVLGKTAWLAADVKEWAGVAQGDAAGLGASTSDTRSASQVSYPYLTSGLTLFHSALVARIKEVCEFPTDSESARLVFGLWWMGLFSPEKLVVCDGTLLDTLGRRRHARRSFRPHAERADMRHQELISRSITVHRRT
jgi:spermidine synthase